MFASSLACLAGPEVSDKWSHRSEGWLQETGVTPWGHVEDSKAHFNQKDQKRDQRIP